PPATQLIQPVQVQSTAFILPALAPFQAPRDAVTQGLTLTDVFFALSAVPVGGVRGPVGDTAPPPVSLLTREAPALPTSPIRPAAVGSSGNTEDGLPASALPGRLLRSLRGYLRRLFDQDWAPAEDEGDAPAQGGPGRPEADETPAADQPAA